MMKSHGTIVLFFLVYGAVSASAQTRYSGATNAQILAACPAFRSPSDIQVLPQSADKGYQAFTAHMGFAGDNFVSPRGDRCACRIDHRDVKGAVCQPIKKAR